MGAGDSSGWCAISESSMSDRKRGIFNVVMDSVVVLKVPSNLRYPCMADDLKLGARYREAMYMTAVLSD